MLKIIVLVFALVLCVNYCAADLRDGTIHTLMNVQSGLFLWGTTDPAQQYCPAGQTTYSRYWMGQAPSGSSTTPTSNDAMWVLKAVPPYTSNVRMLVSYKTGLCLDGNPTAYNQQDPQYPQPFSWTCDPTACNHLWIFTDVGGGAYTIQTSCSYTNKFLDGNTAASSQCDINHPSPFMWPSSGTAWQQWTLAGPHCSAGCSDASRCLPSSNGNAACGEWTSNDVVFDITGVSDILSGMNMADRLDIHTGTSGGDTTVTDSQTSSTQWTFTFLCNRNNQASVGQAFRTANGCPNGQCPSNNYQVCCDTDIQCSRSVQPGSLNFYFSINMSLKDGTSAKFYLGQGHSGADNNWWIGGTAMNFQGCNSNKPLGTYGIITIGSHAIYISRTNANTFRLTKS